MRFRDGIRIEHLEGVNSVAAAKSKLGGLDLLGRVLDGEKNEKHPRSDGEQEEDQQEDPRIFFKDVRHNWIS